MTCSYKWFVEHELIPSGSSPTADPLWLGSIIHDALDRLYSEAPGSDSIPRPGDVDDWQRRFGEVLDEVVAAHGGPLNHARRAALTRARAQVEAFLASESETETAFRPRPDLLEVAFGHFDDQEGPEREPLRLGEVALRGRIDRIDVDETGRAVVHDYKTGKNVTAADKFTEKGKLQIQLYMRVAERILGLDVVGGLYHPLGAVGERKPRGLVAREDEDLKGLGIVGTDRLEHDDFELALDEAEALARDSAAEMRAGEIRRHPIGGKCPEVLQLPGDLPARAGDRRRRERQRRMSALDGQLTLSISSRRRRSRRRPPSPRPRRRARSSRRASSATRSPPASATPFSRPAPARARPPSSWTATAPRSPTTACPSTGSSRSRSPSGPPPRCAPACAAS